MTQFQAAHNPSVTNNLRKRCSDCVGEDRGNVQTNQLIGHQPGARRDGLSKQQVVQRETETADIRTAVPEGIDRMIWHLVDRVSGPDCVARSCRR